MFICMFWFFSFSFLNCYNVVFEKFQHLSINFKVPDIHSVQCWKMKGNIFEFFDITICVPIVCDYS